jgi:two-component system C4-dicarboxylate transport sensor histidine kinase DctB
MQKQKASAKIKARYAFTVVVVLCVLIGYAAFRQIFDQTIEKEAARHRQNLETVSLSINATLSKYEELPQAIAKDARIHAALKAKATERTLEQANEYLTEINRILGTDTIYIMNHNGLTLASSNWDQPDTYVGDNYSFRPYFMGAMEKGIGKFYGIGVASGKPGYYIACPVILGDETLGVITIKIRLSEIQSAIGEFNDYLVVTNEDGIVILSSEATQLYKATRQLTPETLEKIRITRQFYGQSLDLFEFHGAALSIDDDNERKLLNGESYLVQSVPLGGRGWDIVQIGSTRETRTVALATAGAIGFAFGFLLISLLNWYYRRAAHREKLEIFANIEMQIQDRTIELTSKIHDLEKAEIILKKTRDDAVQAGKLAALGQMAAGVTHELSQPLSAIQLYAGNTKKLLESGNLPLAFENIDSINALVTRAGAILSELKTLYRNDETRVEPIVLNTIIQNAVLVMNPFIRKANIRLDIERLDDKVMSSTGKLEQVFINLMSNSVDALASNDDGIISIQCARLGEKVVVRYVDNGPGLSEEAAGKIFEPFFTTKPSGKGLGLGLAISKFIVDAIGGKIECHNLPAGGLEFTIVLRHVSD